MPRVSELAAQLERCVVPENHLRQILRTADKASGLDEKDAAAIEAILAAIKSFEDSRGT